MATTVTLTSRLWLWTSDKGNWHFVTIPTDDAIELKLQAMAEPRRGFGAVRVVARIGAVKWRTSMFPQKNGGYFLPVKADVRAQADIAAGDNVALILDLV